MPVSFSLGLMISPNLHCKIENINSIQGKNEKFINLIDFGGSIV